MIASSGATTTSGGEPTPASASAQRRPRGETDRPGRRRSRRIMLEEFPAGDVLHGCLLTPSPTSAISPRRGSAASGCGCKCPRQMLVIAASMSCRSGSGSFARSANRRHDLARLAVSRTAGPRCRSGLPAPVQLAALGEALDGEHPSGRRRRHGHGARAQPARRLGGRCRAPHWAMAAAELYGPLSIEGTSRRTHRQGHFPLDDRRCASFPLTCEFDHSRISFV